MKISDEIRRVAYEAYEKKGWTNQGNLTAALEAVAPMIRAEEREACATLAENICRSDPYRNNHIISNRIGAAIRARKETP